MLTYMGILHSNIEFKDVYPGPQTWADYFWAVDDRVFFHYCAIKASIFLCELIYCFFFFKELSVLDIPERSNSS